jgi:acetoin utilization deacetylase AcuC-like enzyme
MAKVTTGIFYHPSFSRQSYLTVGARLADFPRVLDRLLESDKVKLYEPEPVSRELLLKIHTPDLLERVGGSHRRLATYLIPPIIERLAGL